MSGAPASRVTQAQFEHGKRQRLYAEDMQEQNWYLARSTGRQARQLGAYALEALVLLVALKPLDGNHEAQVVILDDDGQKIGEGETIIHQDGLARAPDEPGEVGYFMDYPGNLSGVIDEIGQEELLYQTAH